MAYGLHPINTMASPVAPSPVDELLLGPGDGADPRPHVAAYWNWLKSQPEQTIEKARQDADLLFRRVGITFNVYGDEAGAERLIPFDLIPRIIPWNEWQQLERGLRQRLQALNAFIQDIYSDQRILAQKVVPADLILGKASTGRS